MTDVELLLTILTQFILITLSLITLFNFFRQPDGPRRDIALAFLALATPYYIQVIVPPIIHIFSMEVLLLLGFTGYVALFAQPYLMLCLVRYVRTVPNYVMWGALSGMILTCLLLIRQGQDALLPVTAMIYFAFADGYAMVGFLRGAAESSGVTGRRLRAAAIGCGLLAIALGLACLQLIFPTVVIPLPFVLVLTISMGLSYYIAFAAPRWLRRIWQYSEFQAFLLASRENRNFSEESIFDLLCSAAVRSAGGFSAMAVKWDSKTGGWTVIQRSGPVPVDTPAGDAIFTTVLHADAPLMLRRSRKMDASSSALLSSPNTRSVLIAPIAGPNAEPWGVLVVFQYYSSLFVEDDMRLLELYTQHGAMLLENGAMVAQLSVYSHELETIIEERTTELRHSEERYRQIIELAQEGIWVFDSDSRTALANPKLAEMLGHTADEMSGLPFSDFVESGISLPDVLKARQEATDETPQYELELRRKDDSSVWAYFSATALPDIGERKGGVLAMVVDISARKQAEEEIYKLNSELEQRVADRTQQLQLVNEELEAFNYSVSHDLRAPLRSITGFAQALLEDHADTMQASGKGYLDRISRAGIRMGNLIDDLLQLSKVARAELYRRNIDISRIARDILSDLAEQNPDRSVDWTVEEGLSANVDSGLMRVALENLLNNAWKYTRKKETSKIEFGQTELDGQTVFFVRDDGVGFDMAYSDKLFGAFQRLHHITDFEGTGIGLATVRRILLRHGGTIWAEAAVDKGATFYFTLGA